MISAPTKEQWLSILRNTVLAFVAAFGIALSTSSEISNATIKAAAIAGLMAAFKTIEKLFSEPKLS